jgi:hypothetical protein
LTPFFGEKTAIDGGAEVIWGVSDGGHRVAYPDSGLVHGTAIWFDSMDF